MEAPEAIINDSWLHGIPNLDWDEWKEIPRDAFFCVPTSARGEGLQLLEDIPFVELSEKKLAIFVPKNIPHPMGTTPFLIRGVFLAQADGNPMGTGQFMCYQRKRDVLVLFGCLGRKAYGMGKSVLVIWLPFKPTEVFVLYQMAV
jgi:hypothetical protein